MCLQKTPLYVFRAWKGLRPSVDPRTRESLKVDKHRCAFSNLWTRNSSRVSLEARTWRGKLFKKRRTVRASGLTLLEFRVHRLLKAHLCLPMTETLIDCCFRPLYKCTLTNLIN